MLEMRNAGFLLLQPIQIRGWSDSIVWDYCEILLWHLNSALLISVVWISVATWIDLNDELTDILLTLIRRALFTFCADVRANVQCKRVSQHSLNLWLQEIDGVLHWIYLYHLKLQLHHLFFCILFKGDFAILVGNLYGNDYSLLELSEFCIDCCCYFSGG